MILGTSNKFLERPVSSKLCLHLTHDMEFKTWTSLKSIRRSQKSKHFKRGLLVYMAMCSLNLNHHGKSPTKGSSQFFRRWPKLFGNRGRDHLGMVGDFISESRAI